MGTKFFYKDIDLIYFVNNKLIYSCTSIAHTLDTPSNAYPLNFVRGSLWYPKGQQERYARAKQTLYTPVNAYPRYPKGQLVKDLINQKDRVLLSFSGGQDSICFVFILNQFCCQLELNITFFWCHHLWQTDSFYLMQQIAKLSFLFQFKSCFPIPLSCISSELLARKWRQSCSYRVSLFYNYSKICLGHTFNDKIENIFLNFIRGTGLIGLTPLRWIQLAKGISKPNIILNNFVNTAYPFFCISPYKSPDKSPSLNPEGVSCATCKGLRTRLFFCRCTNSSCVIIDSKKNKRSLPHTNRRFVRGYGGITKSDASLCERMVPTRLNLPASAFSLRGDPHAVARVTPRAVARKNPTEKHISRPNYPTHTPDKSLICKGYPNTHAKSSSLNPSGALEENEMCCTNQRFVMRAELATCKECSYSNSNEAWKLNGSKAHTYTSYKSKICMGLTPSNAFPLNFVRGSLRYPKGQLVKEMCIPSTQGNFDKLKNLSKEIIRKFIQKDFHTPLEKGKPLLRLAHKKSKVEDFLLQQHEDFIEEELAHRQKEKKVLNLLQIKDLSGVNISLQHIPQLRFVTGTHTNLQALTPKGSAALLSMRLLRTGGTATCKEYAYSFGVTEGNVMFASHGLNKPLNKAWGKQLLDGCYIVRPLLSISRIELNKICYFWELPIYPDKSNQKVKFLRNRVRGQLLPTIKLFFNLNIENIFLQLAKIVETEDYCLTQIVNEFTKNTDMYHTKLDICSKRKK